ANMDSRVSTLNNHIDFHILFSLFLLKATIEITKTLQEMETQMKRIPWMREIQETIETKAHEHLQKMTLKINTAFHETSDGSYMEQQLSTSHDLRRRESAVSQANKTTKR